MKNGEQEGRKKGGCLKTALIILLVIIVAVAAIIFIWLRTHQDEINELMNSRHTDTLTGQKAPDFEVTTTEGETVTMSSLLENKEALAVVLFATWCGPCEEEFPEMDVIYSKYKDKLGMIAIDVDSLDTETTLKKYAEEHNLSFPLAMGNDSLGIITTNTYPTILIIDRNGKIGMFRVGSVFTGEIFEKIVTTFMGDEYEERQLGFYTFYAYSNKKPAAGVEFTVTSESGTETYYTGEDGIYNLFTDKPEDMAVKVISVPDGATINGTGEIQSGTGSTIIELPVK